jgi:CRISPR system Cascade subunit CasE
MFLSKWQLELTPQLARNPYQIHKLLWWAFPDMPEAERPLLFRLENQARSRFQTVLMQSSICPRVVNAGSLSFLAQKEFQPNFQNGQYLRFLVRVNPVKRLAEARKRVPLIDEDDQVLWLQRQLKDAAELDWEQIRIETKDTLFFRKCKTSGKIFTVTFSGILKVKDSNALRQVMENGIGPAKCFGCGLLSLARA